MRVLAIVHQPDAGPGVFGAAIRERGAQLDAWLPAEAPAPAGIDDYDAVITLGGAMHVDHEEQHPWLADEKRLLEEVLRVRIPLIGVCLGAQLVAEAAGGSARRASEPEIGWFEVQLTEEGAGDPVVGPLAPDFEAYEWHSYEFGLPPGAVPLARSAVCLQAFRAPPATWGIQFHAEVSADDAAQWIDDYQVDEDAVRIGLDAERFAAQTRERIADWNRLGRELCGRFLDVAEAWGRST